MNTVSKNTVITTTYFVLRVSFKEVISYSMWRWINTNLQLKEYRIQPMENLSLRIQYSILLYLLKQVLLTLLNEKCTGTSTAVSVHHRISLWASKRCCEAYTTRSNKNATHTTSSTNRFKFDVRHLSRIKSTELRHTTQHTWGKFCCISH